MTSTDTQQISHISLTFELEQINGTGKTLNCKSKKKRERREAIDQMYKYRSRERSVVRPPHFPSVLTAHRNNQK